MIWPIVNTSYQDQFKHSSPNKFQLKFSNVEQESWRLFSDLFSLLLLFDKFFLVAVEKDQRDKKCNKCSRKAVLLCGSKLLSLLYLRPQSSLEDHQQLKAVPFSYCNVNPQDSNCLFSVNQCLYLKNPADGAIYKQITLNQNGFLATTFEISRLATAN